MKKDLINSAVAVILLTLLLGLGYPLLITGVSQAVMPGKANGSQIKQGDRSVASALIAQPFTKPVLDAKGKPKKDADGNEITVPDPKFFQPRPSTTGYNAAASAFSNAGPNAKATRDAIKDYIKSYLDLEGKYSPDLTASQLPVDAISDSGSNLDPLISIANAQIQSRRIAAVRGLSPAEVKKLVDKNTVGRALGVFGEPGVNVVKLNLALENK